MGDMDDKLRPAAEMMPTLCLWKECGRARIMDESKAASCGTT